MPDSHIPVCSTTEASSIKQVTSSSLDARLYRTPYKAPYFNYIIKIYTRLRPSIYYNSINTRIKRCTRCRRRRKCEPIPKLIIMLASIVLNTLNSSNSKTFKKLNKSSIDTTIKTHKLIKVAAIKVNNKKRKSLGLKPKN